MSNSDSKPLRSGWGVETIRTLAPSRRVGGEFFNLGRRPGISVVRQNGKDLLIVGDEFGYLQIYEDFLSPNPKILNSDKIGLHNDHEPLGAPAGSNPDANIYPTAYPSQCEGEFDIIAYYHAQREICHNARISDEPPLNFTWHWSVLAASGIPAVFRPERDARTELLVGGFDGTLRRHALVNSQKTKATCLDIGTDLEFSTDGEVVFAGDEPIHFDDWCYPCIVDWDGQGTQDLLVGTAEGLLYLFRDIGDETHLIFERPVLLQASSGTVKADSFAAPAVLQGENGVKGVLLAGGGGEIHYHPRESRETLISKDIAAIFAESSRISRDTYKKGEWWLRQQLPESENGQMLTNCPVTGDQSEIFPEIVMENLPDDLTINVDFPGKHEIHITFFEPSFLKNKNLLLSTGKIIPKVFVKLSSDKSWRIIQCLETVSESRKKVFFKAADLKGENIQFRAVSTATNLTGAAWPVFIESIRLVPCDDVAKSATTSIPPDSLSIRGIADAAMWYHRQTHLETQEEMDILFGAHHDAGFDLLYYKLGGAAWEYPSKIPGTQMCVESTPEGITYSSPWGDDAMRIPEGVDRLAMAVNSNRKYKMRIFGWIRIQNYAEHINNGFPVSEFHRDNPQLWETNRNGKPNFGKMSLAFPEVRHFILEIINEAVNYGLDGILMDFLRQLPAVLFPEPVLDKFKELYGEDARKVPPTDTRLLKVQAEFTNILLSEIREALDRIHPDKELHIRIGSPYLGHGLDPAAIAASGNVDEIIIEYRGPDPHEPELAEMLKVAQNTNCRIVPSFQRTYWGKSKLPMHPKTIRKTVERFYAAGARAISFYECTEGIMNPNYCRALRSLKNSEEHEPIFI